MTLLHGRWQLRVSLLASGDLEPGLIGATERHLAGCPACRADLAAAHELLALLEHDAVRNAELPIPLSALVTRTRARLHGTEPARLAWLWPALGAAATLLALLTIPAPPPPVTREPALAEAVPEDALRRMESSVAREQAARYLTDAQAVLIQVSATPADCDRKQDRVDVGEEARRSRELLARRALLFDLEKDDVAVARGVVEDVDLMLREVAALDACVRRKDLGAIHSALQRRRLLMKIDLTTRELLG
jgi:hypothetical protein